MSARLEGRIAKVEAIAKRGEIGNEVDRCLEKMGTTRAAMMAKHGNLRAFRDWLKAQPAGEILIL